MISSSRAAASALKKAPKRPVKKPKDELEGFPQFYRLDGILAKVEPSAKRSLSLLIRHHRQALGLSVEDFTKLLRSHQREAIYNWERGDRKPPGDRLYDIAEILGLPYPVLKGLHCDFTWQDMKELCTWYECNSAIGLTKEEINAIGRDRK